MWWTWLILERFAMGAGRAGLEGEDGEWDYGCCFRISGTRGIDLGRMLVRWWRKMKDGYAGICELG